MVWVLKIKPIDVVEDGFASKASPIVAITFALFGHQSPQPFLRHLCGCCLSALPDVFVLTGDKRSDLYPGMFAGRHDFVHPKVSGCIIFVCCIDGPRARKNCHLLVSPL